VKLSLVLHTHMPYVEGFGTWPFGEEWLWEAMATCYLPLLDVLDEHPGRVTVSMTPVLADQLRAPGIGDRFLAFMRGVREASHRLDREARPDLLDQLDHSLTRYRRAVKAFQRRSGDLVGAFAPHVAWTSAATHAVLPLLATDAGVRLQLETGIAAHRERFAGWGGGFWLPECAYEPWLDAHLEAAGARVACVELTDLGVDPRRPLRTPAGVLLAPIDRAVIDLVWGADGYPSGGAYLDTHNLTERDHLAWAVDQTPYVPSRAASQVRADAADFLARVREGDGLCVCALDTELLGHWWVEGVDWLGAVLDGAADAGVEIVPLTAELAESFDPRTAPALPVTTWGTPRTLATWSGPPARGIAWRARAAELRTLAGDPSARELRELLALQSSDWAFLVTNGTAGEYPMQRFEGHLAALAAAESDPRGLAPFLG
jgi:1,4-alpha-glucan branching enzyme